MVLSENDVKNIVGSFVNDDLVVKFRDFNNSQNQLKNVIVKRKKDFINMEIPAEELDSLFLNSLEVLDKQGKRFSLLLSEIDKLVKSIPKVNKIEYLSVVRADVLEIVNILLDEKKLVSQARMNFKNWGVGEYNSFYNMLNICLRNEKGIYLSTEKNFYLLLNEVRLKVSSIKTKKLVRELGSLLMLKIVAFWGVVHDKAHDLVHFVIVGFDGMIDAGKFLDSSKRGVVSALESVY